MPAPRLGVILDDDTQHLTRARDPISVVALRGTLLNPPRAKAASQIGSRLRATYSGAELAIYGWHYLTHVAADGLCTQATRSLGSATGDAAWGHLQQTPVTQEAWSITRQVATGIEARTTVLSTPPSFSPSSLNRRRMRAFVTERQTPELQLVWDVRGLWDTADALMFAAELGMGVMIPAAELGHSALRYDVPVWIRLEQGTREIDPMLDLLASEQSLCARVTVMFAGRYAPADLRRFAAQISDER